MPKRRAAPTLREESSELSPPPDILADDEDVVERAVAPARSNNTKAKPVKNKKGAASRVNKKSASIDSETAYVNGSTVKTEAVKGKTKEEEVATNGTPKRSRKRKIKAEEATEELNGLQGSEAAEPKPKKRQRKSEVKEEKAELDEDGNIIANKVKRKRKTKEEKEAEAMPLAARTVGHKMFVGAHVSSAGGQSMSSDSYIAMIAHHVDHTESCLNCRCSKRCSQFRPHRCERLCTLPQIPAEVGQPATSGRAVFHLPPEL